MTDDSLDISIREKKIYLKKLMLKNWVKAFYSIIAVILLDG